SAVVDQPNLALIDDVSLPGTTRFGIPIGANLAIGLAGFYILFVFYRGGGLLKAWLRTRAIAKRSYPAPILPHDIQRALGECTAAIGDLDVSVLFSDAVPVPVTIGSRRPVIILPAKLVEETDRNVFVAAFGLGLVA